MATSAAHSRQPNEQQPPPDPCVSYQILLDPQPWPSQELEVMGQPARLFEAGPSSNPGEPIRRHRVSDRPLVLSSTAIASD